MNVDTASPEELLDALAADPTDWPDPSLLKALLDHGAAAVDPLIAVLNAPDAAESPKSFWAAMALCDLGDPRAAEPIVRYLFYLPNDDLDVLEWVPAIYGQLGESALEPLYTVIADDTLPWYAQAMAAETILDWVDAFPTARLRFMAELHASLERWMARAAAGETLDTHGTDLLSTAVDMLIRLRAVESQTLLEAAFVQELVDESVVMRGELAELHKPPTYYQGDKATFLQEYTRRRAEALDREGWEEAADTDRPTVIIRDTPRPRRPGRNDPCHCGSGKKYKKCCLDKDERAGW